MNSSNSNLVTNLTITVTAVAAGLLFAWSISGSGHATVQGTVHLDGQAVPWADVVFVSEDSSVEPIAVKTNENGQYQVTSELPPGSYRVIARGIVANEAVQAGPRSDELDDYQSQMVMSAHQNNSTNSKTIPESYGALETSGLRTAIADGESVEFDLQLESDSPQVAAEKATQFSSVR